MDVLDSCESLVIDRIVVSCQYQWLNDNRCFEIFDLSVACHEVSVCLFIKLYIVKLFFSLTNV